MALPLKKANEEVQLSAGAKKKKKAALVIKNNGCTVTKGIQT